MQLTENLQFAERYILKKQLGRGGFSEVWLASDKWTGLDVAVKVYAPGQGMDADGLKDFSKELANVYNLNHTNLLKPQHVDSWQGMPYLIMAFCEKGSCYKYVGKLKEEEAWKLLSDVASGLSYLHAKEIIHQDIKPDNILIDENGNYLITDFGISVQARTTLRKSVNNANTGGGTTAYMAPERFSRDPKPIKASDIWSLGATLYELVTGRMPFGEVGGGMQRSGASIPTISAPISPNLRQTIIKMLAEDPWERPTASLLADWAQNPEALSLISEEDMSQDDGNSFLKVKPSKIEAKPSGEDINIFVKSESKWRCFCDQTKWCSAEKKDDETLLVKIKPNETGEARKANVNVIAGSRASIVTITQPTLPKRKKTLYLILTAVLLILGIAIIWNASSHSKKEKIFIEKMTNDYTEEVKKCDLFTNNIVKDKKGNIGNVSFIINGLEALKQIEQIESRPLFKKTTIEPCYESKYNAYIMKLNEVHGILTEIYNQKIENGLQDSQLTKDYKERLDLIQRILDQSKTNNGKATLINIVPKKQTN